jgi:hypothetical protein
LERSGDEERMKKDTNGGRMKKRLTAEKERRRHRGNGELEGKTRRLGCRKRQAA